MAAAATVLSVRICGVFGSEGWFKYLLVVELQGTSRGEDKKGGPNPFWGKLRRKRSESCFQHNHQGRAYV